MQGSSSIFYFIIFPHFFISSKEKKISSLRSL